MILFFRRITFEVVCSVGLLFFDGSLRPIGFFNKGVKQACLPHLRMNYVY